VTNLDKMAYQKLIDLITNALSSDRETEEFYLEGDRILVSVTVGSEYVEYVVPIIIHVRVEPVVVGGVGVELK
jgi:hypothetical protein